MKYVVLAAALMAMVLARPETYKENEEFKYSRSSSDEGTKAGFYEAQRGNVGGNYEKAHNMDQPAQKTLSQAISQVDNGFGEHAPRHGDVFSSGSTRGIYNQGMYDLSNLQGRNFQEGSYGDSGTHSSLNSGYGRQSSYSGYGGRSEAYTHQANQNNQAAWNDLAADNFNGGYHAYGKETARSSLYRTEGGYRANSLQNTGAYHNTKSAAPVKIMIRPGSTVNLPLTAETYYDKADSSHYRAQSLTQNVDSELHSGITHQTPAPPKHFESSYEYHKEWEKHSEHPSPAPLAILPVTEAPTREPFDKNYISENVFHNNDFNTKNEFSKYNAETKSESQYRSEYNRQHNSDFASGSNRDYNTKYRDIDTSGLAALTANVPSSVPAPKKYESSYSYHKSWERQGDPYVIKPVAPIPDESQRLTAGNQGYGYSHQYGTKHQQSHSSYTHGAGVECDCDDDHLRVTRSADYSRRSQKQVDDTDDFGQETQSAWDLRNFSQQSAQKDDYVQQSSANLENFGQKSEDLEDFGQNTQHSWNKADLGQIQQSRDELRNFGHQYQGNLNDFHTPTQNSWYPINLDKTSPRSSVTFSHDESTNHEQTLHRRVHNELLPQEENTQNENYFRSKPGNVPFPTQYWHDRTQDYYSVYAQETSKDRDYNFNMHGLNNNDNQQNTYDGLQNTYTHTDQGHNYPVSQDESFALNSNNENNFRSQWTTAKEREILNYNSGESSTTTPTPHSTERNSRRGDIEVDLIGNLPTPKTNQPNQETIHSTNPVSKQYKTQEEISALSQIKPPLQENDEVLGVIGINDQTPGQSNYNHVQTDKTVTDADLGQQVQSSLNWEDHNGYFTGIQSNNPSFPRNSNNYQKISTEPNVIEQKVNEDNLNQQQQTGWVDGLQEFNQQLQSDFKDFKGGQDKEGNVGTENMIVTSNTELLEINKDIQAAETTEKPGFWKSVGNKFVNAKDKVSSWFKSK